MPDATLGLAADEQVIRLQRLRLWGDKPFLAEDIVLPLRRMKGLMEQPTEQFGPLLYPTYEALCGQIVAARPRGTDRGSGRRRSSAGCCAAPPVRRWSRSAGPPSCTTIRRSNGGAATALPANSTTARRSASSRGEEEP